MHRQFPSITRLAVHLENEQIVYFDEDDEEENIEEILNNSKKTTLTEWFNMNLQHPESKHLKYMNFPDEYVWNKSSKTWSKRTQKYSVGRMYFVPPNAGERYYLRLLLTHVPGATSFDFLKTVKGEKFNSYREACIEHGLLEDDTEWDRCLTEASELQTGKQLRNLFAMILAQCDVTYPFKLWEKHKQNLDDLLYQNQKKSNNFNLDLDNRTIQIALIEINQELLKYDKTISLFKDFPDISIPIDKIPSIILKQLNYNKQQLKINVKENLSKFNEHQLKAFKKIEKAINDEHEYSLKPNLFFVGGCGGSGKTFLFNTLLAKVRSENHIAIALASSGIASLLLDDGHTAHSVFKIPLQVNTTSLCNIERNSPLAQLIKETKLFVWDEAPMMSKDVHETVDRSFKDIMKTVNPQLEFVPFGGKLFIFSGDFRQLLPIVRHGNRAKITSVCLNKATFWPSVKCLKLNINMRLNLLNDIDILNQKEFEEYLIKIGNGTEKILNNNNLIELPSDICIKDDNPQSLISWVYNDFATKFHDSNYLTKRAILCTTNRTVKRLNNIILNILPNKITTLYSTDTPIDEGQVSNYPIEYINQFECNGLPSHELTLKPNSIIMLMRNLNLDEGLCNGTRLIVKNIKQHVIEAEILTGKKKGAVIFIPRITLFPEENESPFSFKRRQFPIKLAFALTINKAQGQTINKVGLFIDTNLFCHGHLYTAMSRVCDKNSIKIMFKKRKIKNKEGFFINNVVYPEALIYEK
jgi:hypothetical protein